MFNLRSAIYASVLAAPMFFAAGTASAVVVSGSSGGTFSNVTNCQGDNCRINNTSNGTATQLEWGYKNGFFGNDGSTLTAVDRTWNTTTNADDLILAELVWLNLATPSDVTPNAFNARYTLAISFNNPNVASDTEVFNLQITNPTNSAGDLISGLALADLGNLSFNLNGVVISDLKYKLATGGGSNSFNSNVWYNPENNTSRMYITADFKTAVVPEPASLGLVAAGLFGLGVLRQRRKV
jgi:hypothetical protein